MSELNIYQKLLGITDEISTVAKNLTVGTGKSAYNAVGEADVLAAVKPIEKKWGIYSYPSTRQIVGTDIFIKTSEWEGKVKETQNIFVRIETVYKFVNVEKPEEFIEITTYGDGVDTQDKAPGKAMTYADKYALLKAYKIMTGDDPDQSKSEAGNFRSSEVAKMEESIEKLKQEPITKDQIRDLTTIVSKKIDGTEKKIKLQYAIIDWDELKQGQLTEILHRLEKTANK